MRLVIVINDFYLEGVYVKVSVYFKIVVMIFSNYYKEAGTGWQVE